MKDDPQIARFEPRWPVAVTILGVLGLIASLPNVVKLLPMWTTVALGAFAMVPVAIVGLTSGRARWLRIERGMLLAFFCVSLVLLAANLASLVRVMVYRAADVSGVQLLASSIAAWVSNVLIFSLLYWQTDRGGPEARMNRSGLPTDWLFPQEGTLGKDVPADWRPAFIDYLYLAFSTATSFSASYCMPLTPRAKLLMMMESALSLVTIIVVLGRAINVLGG